MTAPKTFVWGLSPKFSSDETKIIITFGYFKPVIIAVLDATDGTMLSAHSIKGNTFNYEIQFEYKGDVNGNMIFEGWITGDNYYRNIIKMSYPVPTNETLHSIRIHSHSSVNANS